MLLLLLLLQPSARWQVEHLRDVLALEVGGDEVDQHHPRPVLLGGVERGQQLEQDHAHGVPWEAMQHVQCKARKACRECKACREYASNDNSAGCLSRSLQRAHMSTTGDITPRVRYSGLLYTGVCTAICAGRS